MLRDTNTGLRQGEASRALRWRDADIAGRVPTVERALSSTVTLSPKSGAFRVYRSSTTCRFASCGSRPRATRRAHFASNACANTSPATEIANSHWNGTGRKLGPPQETWMACSRCGGSGAL